jgi:hypothetical protein
MGQPDQPTVLHLDDDVSYLESGDRVLNVLGLPHYSELDPSKLMELVRTVRPTVALLDGELSPTHTGFSLMQELDEAGLLMWRGDVLKEGRIFQGRMVAILNTAGVAGENAVHSMQALMEGRFLGACVKKPTSLFKALSFLQDSLITRSSLEGLKIETQRAMMKVIRGGEDMEGILDRFWVNPIRTP